MCNHHLPKPIKNKDTRAQTVHDSEHAKWNRRSFIQALGLAGAGSMFLGSASVTASRPSLLSVALANNESDRILVIVRLKGGNDGLNTIVPVYDYDNYANLRPTIRHEQNNLINLNADFAVPNYTQPFEQLWGDGKMKVVHGVGYPQQNLSHFRSSEIWASTDDVNVEPTGWWGRYFEDLYPDYLTNPPAIPPAVQIGSIGNLIFDGNNSNYAFSVANPQQLQNVAQSGTFHDVVNLPDCVYGDKLLFMRATANTTYQYAGVIHDAYISANNDAPYSDAELANQLAIVARMIKGGLGTKVYMVTLSGFDTHANQVEDHETILSDLSKAMSDFYTDLGASGMQNEVLAMTISEFGRRPYENGSNGTDHGAASPVMLFGPGLNGSGFVGEHPDLLEWDASDNLIPSSDFRDVYFSVLTRWFCLDPSIIDDILLNQTYNELNLGLSCDPLSTQNFGDVTKITHVATYRNGTTYIEINTPFTANINVILYDILGKELGTLKNELMFPGHHIIDIKASLNQRLSYGQYIYRIRAGGENYSAPVLIK